MTMCRRFKGEPTRGKPITSMALRELREAHEERRGGSPLGNYSADLREQVVAGLLANDGPLELGAGGEAIPEPGEGQARAILRETLSEGAGRVAEEASIARATLLIQPNLGVAAMALDAAESMGAGNSLERMLGHQMAVAHEAAMRLMNRAMRHTEDGGDSVEAARLANTAARLLSVFQDGLLTLQRLRTGGAQTVTVQHVTMQPGAQAVIGNVSAGGARQARGGRG